MTRVIARGARAFVRFVVDFLFGDSLVIFPATLVIVLIAYALRHERAAAIVAVPLLVSALIGGTAFIGRRRPATSDDTVKEPGPG
jgi:hypothetical protein